MVAASVNEKADQLEALAGEHFPGRPLTPAEISFVRAVAVGELVYYWPDEDPANGDKWGENRQIRAELIRWLCVKQKAKELVDPKGIRVLSAKITGALDLSYVSVPFGVTLARCYMREPARLVGADIGELNLQGSQSGPIAADRVRVKGDVFLRNGFAAKGKVRLLGAQIGGSLDWGGGTFENPPQAGVEGSGDALSADRAAVKGGVYLGRGFTAKGAVRLLGALIGGDLSCIGAAIAGQFTLQDAVVKRTLLWQGVAEPSGATLVLVDASVDTLVDDAKSWPESGKLRLDGFVYRRFSGGAPRDAARRLDWLSRSSPFSPQPYRQLAKVLREEGDDAGARRVLFDMEGLRRRERRPGWTPNAQHGASRRSLSYFGHIFKFVAVPVWNFVLRWTIGYGYYPGRALAWLLVFVALGWPLYQVGHRVKYIVPTDEKAYAELKDCGETPEHYERFHALVYSIENGFPLVKLGQEEHWQPDPSPTRVEEPGKAWWRRVGRFFISAGFLRGYRWFQICAGWFLATLFGAGVTGIVRKE